ncbi:MAG: lipoyl(octanoyl) transferase LipB [Marinagarivorans sp.]
MSLVVKQLGLCAYTPVWEAMRAFTDQRDEACADEIWCVEHLPVFTQGQAGRPEHLLSEGTIPLVASDRGGQITYHGPGQLVVYPLLDLRRRGLGVRQMVNLLEQTCIDLLAHWQINAQAKPDAPGVYVGRNGERKIASLGLRVRKGCCYHGISINVAMDLAPFRQINPCGYAGLEMAQMSEFVPAIDVASVTERYVSVLIQALGQSSAAIIQ